jgi:hypothetical protein
MMPDMTPEISRLAPEQFTLAYRNALIIAIRRSDYGLLKLAFPKIWRSDKDWLISNLPKIVLNECWPEIFEWYRMISLIRKADAMPMEEQRIYAGFLRDLCITNKQPDMFWLFEMAKHVPFTAVQSYEQATAWYAFHGKMEADRRKANCKLAEKKIGYSVDFRFHRDIEDFMNLLVQYHIDVVQIDLLLHLMAVRSLSYKSQRDHALKIWKGERSERLQAPAKTELPWYCWGEDTVVFAKTIEVMTRYCGRIQPYFSNNYDANRRLLIYSSQHATKYQLDKFTFEDFDRSKADPSDWHVMWRREALKHLLRYDNLRLPKVLDMWQKFGMKQAEIYTKWVVKKKFSVEDMYND